MRFGILLAGGASRRMGTNKALLNYDGIPLGELALRKLREVCGENAEVLISGSLPGMEQFCVPDEKTGLGPVGGLTSVWKYLRQKHGTSMELAEVLVIPVDMPGLVIKDLSLLLNALKGAECAVFQGYALPLAFRLTDRFADYCEDRVGGLSERERSLQGLARFLGRIELPFSGDSSKLSNLNTPQEWNEFLANRPL